MHEIAVLLWEGKDGRLQKRRICLLYDGVALRGLGGIRSTGHHHPPRLRRGPCAPGLDASHDESGAALSAAGIAADHAASARGGLLDFQSARHDRMPDGWNRLRDYFA